MPPTFSNRQTPMLQPLSAHYPEVVKLRQRANELWKAPFSVSVCQQLVQQALLLPCRSYLVEEYALAHWHKFYSAIIRHIASGTDEIQRRRGLMWVQAFFEAGDSMLDLPCATMSWSPEATVARRVASTLRTGTTVSTPSSYDLFAAAVGDAFGPSSLCDEDSPAAGRRGLPNLATRAT